MLTILSNKVWRLKNLKAFILNALDFQPSEGVVAPLLSLKSWLRDNWTTAHRKAYEMEAVSSGQ